ncbi:MAG: ferritin-like domain-containing protein [Actinomycetota bacterium]|nr:ferritin-like domain-containing protein [Actinomycetota bacterium]
MAGSSAELHEDESRLQPATIDRHRAIVSIMEELEAVDWYDQRADGTDDPELAEILRHNRDEEKEHAVMTLEWLRRHDPVLDQHLRHFLFTDGPILKAEEELTGGAAAASPSSPSLGIGSMRGREEL